MHDPEVGVVGDAQKVWTLQLLYGSLIPFDHCTLDFIGLEKSENAWGSVVRVLGGGSSGISRNPNHDGTKSVHPVLACPRQRVEDTIDSLGREMRVSALRDGEGIFEEIRAVEWLRRVRRGPPIRENVWGDSGGTRGNGERGEVARRLAKGWRGGDRSGKCGTDADKRPAVSNSSFVYGKASKENAGIYEGKDGGTRSEDSCSMC
ncbi:hypothetical protein EDB85DRAFT_2273949 [Lactarius pseudohatsudake]|nr:hypothetical protein EDB85DRAFT_2273949 [Lactarius pseudohatsudake]